MSKNSTGLSFSLKRALAITQSKQRLANIIEAQPSGKKCSHLIFYISLLLYFCIVMSACKNSNRDGLEDANNCYVEECNGHYEIKSESMGIQGLQIIDLSQVWEKTNSFGFQYLNGNYRGEGDLYLDIKNNGDELIRAEEVISYVPSIWGLENDPVIQYIELDKLAYNKRNELKIKKGIVIYPQPSRKKDSELDKYFSHISKKQLVKAVKEYYSSVENKEEKADKKYYLEYAEKYKPGDYQSGKIGEMFDILDTTYEIILTYKGSDREYTKNISYYIYHGN